MLLTLGIILIALWILGLIFNIMAGGLIYILLALGIIMLIVHLAAGHSHNTV